MRFLQRLLGRLLYHHWYVFGNEYRLEFTDMESCGLANTLFNTVSGRIVVGRDVVFGHNVMVLTGRHTIGDVHDIPKVGFDIVIQTGAWICSGAVILGGVTVGAGSVVAAGSVVTHDVPERVLVAGVPAKVVKSL